APVGRGYWAACLLQILFSPLFVADEGQITAGAFKNMQCLNNYGSQGRRVNCKWHCDELLGEAQFYLNFSDILGLHSDLICNLSASVDEPDRFSCSVWSEEGEFTENDAYVVSLHVTALGKNRSVYPIFQGYKPSLHIECDPPFGLQSNMSTDKCRIQWKKPEAYEEIGIEEWKCELAVKTTAVPWEKAQIKDLDTKETWVEIEGSEFKPMVDYVARMRCKTLDQHQYKSHWSPWSQATEWRTPPGKRQEWLDSPLARAMLISLPLSLGPLLFLLLALRFFWRLSGDGGTKIPSPAAFFQPLYTAYGGDFKRWAGHAETGAWLRSSTEGSGGSKGGSENATVALSQISFRGCSEEEKAAEEESESRKRRGPLPRAPGSPHVASKESTLKAEQKELCRACGCDAEPPQPVSGGGSPRQEGPPPPSCTGCSLLAQDPWEAKILFFCSPDYCTLGGGNSQQGSPSPALCRMPEPSCC
ncbi:Interleukin-9 receptor, partial [Varanus komodoensis]